HSLLDHLLGLPSRDWIADAQRRLKQRTQAERAQAKARQKQRQEGTKPSRELPAYAGTYEHAGYGRAEVTTSQEGLRLRWGRVERNLNHWHFDTFQFELPKPHMFYTGDPRVLFRIGSDGEVATMTFLDQEFTKAKKPAAKPIEKTPAEKVGTIFLDKKQVAA